ncbi:MAG: hypothetical protein AAGF12_01445 [Myxococcota bacterium]
MRFLLLSVAAVLMVACEPHVSLVSAQASEDERLDVDTRRAKAVVARIQRAIRYRKRDALVPLVGDPDLRAGLLRWRGARWPDGPFRGSYRREDQLVLRYGTDCAGGDACVHEYQLTFAGRRGRFVLMDAQRFGW